ncbi:MAG: hypothetical protein HOV68_13110 [Streptomycetaceae bacterium]|nr:hypothetical protein [Streptomycetaceae bacterium]
MFADPAAGRSSLRLHAPDGTDTGTTLEWPALRNDYNIRISWSFRDAQGEAFWVVRGSTTADDAHVLSNPLPAGTRHVLHAAPDGRRLVTVTCPAPCAHEEWHLAHLAADLAGLAHDGEVPPGTVPQPPELRGTAVTLDHRPDGTSELRRHDSVTHFAWEVPVDRRTLTALAAHAVRTIAAA